MQPQPPALSYARPTAPLTQARAVETKDGARIAVFVYGELDGQETPVLFLHGNGGRHLSFGPVIDAVVASGRAAIAVDSRGQGKSTRGSLRLSYELLAEDALLALDALGTSRAHVLGYSDGGIEALIIARDAPERVASITALGANLTPEGVFTGSDWDMAGDAAVLRAWELHSFGEHIDRSLLTPTPDEARVQAELLELMMEEPHIDPASLASIGCPASIVVGEFDCIRDDETVAIARAIPSARLLVVPEAGHGLPKQAPAAVAAALFSAIARAECRNQA